MAYDGPLETHWTLSEGVGDLDALARALGLRALRIELAAGVTPVQPMLTRRRQGSLASELAAAEGVSRALGQQGVAVRRVKIEAHPDNADVPQGLHDEGSASEGRYFEHHVKLSLTPGDSRVVAVARAHGAHLSRNALRIGREGLEERFLTQRCRGQGRLAARERLDALVATLCDLGLTVLGAEQEYVIYDSDEALDRGWMEGA
jgi:hypothetical protein